MKKLLTALLALILCLSLCACEFSDVLELLPFGEPEIDGDLLEAAQLYDKYDRLIDMLEDEEYEEAIDYIRDLGDLEEPEEDKKQDQSSGSTSGKPTGGNTPAETVRPAVEDPPAPTAAPADATVDRHHAELATVEITMENWLDYFEICVQDNYGYDSNGEINVMERTYFFGTKPEIFPAEEGCDVFVEFQIIETDCECRFDTERMEVAYFNAFESRESIGTGELFLCGGFLHRPDNTYFGTPMITEVYPVENSVVPIAEEINVQLVEGILSFYP